MHIALGVPHLKAGSPWAVFDVNMTHGRVVIQLSHYFRRTLLYNFAISEPRNIPLHTPKPIK